jgi:perosamine synthetase
VHHEVGYNYRLTNLLAAMGCAQMEQLDRFVDAKRQIAKRYQESLASHPGIRLPEEAEWAFSTFWMYTVLIDEKQSGIDSRRLLRELNAKKIQTRPLWQPIHRSPAHDPSGSPNCPNAEFIHGQAISLPCSVGLSPSAQNQVIEAIASLVGERNLSVRAR